jgi:hypothetical protein
MELDSKQLLDVPAYLIQRAIVEERRLKMTTFYRRGEVWNVAVVISALLVMLS